VACLLTVLTAKVMQSSVRPFVSTLSFETADLCPGFFCMCMGRDRRSPGIESQGHILRSKVSVLFDYLLWRPVSID